MTPERVSKRLATIVSELLPCEPREDYFDRARAVLTMTAAIIEAEERRERPEAVPHDLEERAAARWSDVVGWRCSVSARTCRPVMRRNRAA